MLTPSFDLTQDDNFLILKIQAPYTKVSETEIFFEGTEFKFFSKPYFLRLNFPGSVTENGSESATYSADDGCYFIKMAKSCPGEWFPGLDLQTKLLAPKGRVSVPTLIEVVGAQNNNCEISGNLEDEEEFDWEIYQNQYAEEHQEDVFTTFQYGFASLKTDVKIFSRLQEEMPDLLDIRFAQHTMSSLEKEKYDTESTDFCDEHYLADLYLVDVGDEVKSILSYEPPWLKLEKMQSQNPFLVSEELVVYTEEEKAKMRNLPNKEFLLDHDVKQQALLSLVDILFAYAYDVRTTQGEHTVESAWTICKLSSTLSWLTAFTSLESVVISSIRRSLCYPLYRRWDLAAIVLSDTIRILTLGPRYVLKCLLDMHSLFNESDPRYILNDLYITDYCVWIQTLKSKSLTSLSEALRKMPVSKVSVSLDLDALEQSALLALEDQAEDKEELDRRFNVLQIDSSSSQSDSSSYVSVCESLPCDRSSESDSSSSTSSSEDGDIDHDKGDNIKFNQTDSDDYSSSDNSDSSDEDQFLLAEQQQPTIRYRKTLCNDNHIGNDISKTNTLE